MSDTVTITLIILSELALLQTIAMTVLFIRRKKKLAASTKLAKSVYNSIKNDVRRKDRLSTLLRNVYEVDLNNESATTVDEIINEENSLFSNLIHAIANSDFERVKQLSDQPHPYFKRYHNLTLAVKEKLKQQSGQMLSEKQDLQKDVDRLRNELKSTLETMEQTLSEYANAYATKVDGANDNKKYQDLKSAVDNAKQSADTTLNELDQNSKNTAASATENPQIKTAAETITETTDSAQTEPEVTHGLTEEGSTSKAALDTIPGESPAVVSNNLNNSEPSPTPENSLSDAPLDLGFEKMKEIQIDNEIKADKQSVANAALSEDAIEIPEAKADDKSNSSTVSPQDESILNNSKVTSAATMADEETVNLNIEADVEADVGLDADIDSKLNDFNELDEIDADNIDQLLEEQQKSAKQA